MNQLKLLFTFLILYSASYAQSRDSVVVLFRERHIALNGGARSQVGGKSRESIKIDLPPNTKSWYYSFTTSSNQSGTDNLNLAAQLGTLILTQGRAGELVSYIKVPPGTGSLDVLLCDYNNMVTFMNKDDYWGTDIRYYLEGTVQNTKSAPVFIDDIRSGTVYLCLRNPGTWDAVDIRIEAAAIVDFSPQASWSNQMIASLHNEFRKRLMAGGMEHMTAEELATCMTDYVISNYSAQEAKALTKIDLEHLEAAVKAQCVEEEVNCAQAEQASSYGSLGWTAFENGKIADCIKYSEKALSLCAENMTWVEANLGLCYLIQQDEDKAMDYYIQAITSGKKSISGKQQLKAALNDLDTYKSEYPIILEYPEIRDLLEYELK